MLNKTGKSGHPCLVPNLRGIAFSFSLLNMMLAVVLSYVTFIMLRYIYSIPILLRVFIINEYWMLSNAFCAPIEMIIQFLFLILLMWYISLVDLWMLNHPCIPGINHTWSHCILLMYCCICFVNILLTTFVSMFIRDTDLYNSFFALLLSGFGIR